MKSYTYENTLTNIPNWEKTTHQTQKFGYGYETLTHFVHFYGQEDFYTIHAGLTVIEEKNGSFNDWVIKRFGANNIEEMNLEVGTTVEGVWRPSLFYWEDIRNGIKTKENEQHSEEQALRILIDKLDELLLFIEPSIDGLNSYSHKIRELLILACTEVENQWRALLEIAGCIPINGKMFTTQDYVKILTPTHIGEYKVGLKNNSAFLPSKPFVSWDLSNPTKSIDWYDAYNKTKHNREYNFQDAKLKFAIDAVAANIILYCTRFGALILLQDTSTLSGLVKQIFEIKMINANRKSFYLPELEFPNDIRKDCFVYDSYRNKHNKTWNIQKLII